VPSPAKTSFNPVNPSASGDTAEDGARLLDAARALVAVVRERAGEAEGQRRIPVETDRAFREAGFYRSLQPQRFGGLELDYGIHTELAAEIARGCASSGWVLSVIACHAWILGMFPPEAQHEFWDGDPARIIASSFLPDRGTVTRENGGFRVDGRWKFSSGVDHCDGLLLLATLPGADGASQPDPHFLLLPREDYRIEDTWHVTGLAATGSNDVVIDAAFVPRHRALRIKDALGGSTPGSAVNASHIYRLPLFAVFPYTLVGAAVGAAQGAMDLLAEGLAGRKSAAQLKLREQQPVQMRIAEAAAQLDAAWALLRRDAAKINEQGRAGVLPDAHERVRYRVNLAYATKLCVGAMQEIFPLLGGRGLATGDPVQRAWRDVHAVSQHIALVWDINAVNYGAVRLGLPCPDPRI
jgi:3-hydroxy-9,10-secoandrosta-1,3,5(10)-triene-9,17-dione monooxygenase